MQCLILAGGLATRMRPLTITIPKILLPVRGRPFVEHQLELLRLNGATEVVLSIGYLGEQVVQHVGDGTRFGLKVKYVDEGAMLRGTGGAVRFALEQGALQKAFLVMYGDSYLPVAIQPIWEAFSGFNKPALMTVYKNEARWEESNVRFENGTIVCYQKGIRNDPRFRYVDYGLMILTERFISTYIDQEVPRDLAVGLGKASLNGDLAGWEVFHRFYEIGSPEGLEDLDKYFSQREESSEPGRL